MEVTINQTATIDFTLSNPTTGQVQDADFLPTCQIFESTNDSPLLTPMVVKRIGQIGDYQITFIASASNGFIVGTAYNVVVEATVAGVTDKAVINSFILQLPISIPVKTRL
jgi:hypothetical protein